MDPNATWGLLLAEQARDMAELDARDEAKPIANLIGRAQLYARGGVVLERSTLAHWTRFGPEQLKPMTAHMGTATQEDAAKVDKCVSEGFTYGRMI